MYTAFWGFLCACCNFFCYSFPSSVSEKYMQSLWGGKWSGRWCDAFCVFVWNICAQRIRTSEGTLNFRPLISKCIPVKRAKRLFSVILVQSYPKVLISWEILCHCCGVVQLGYFSFVFCRALWFERGFSWFPASFITKKIRNLNRHKDFWYPNVRAWTKISIRLAFTSAYVSLETGIRRALVLAIPYAPKACFVSPFL